MTYFITPSDLSHSSYVGSENGGYVGHGGGGKVESKLGHTLLYVFLSDSAYRHPSTYTCQDFLYNYFI